MNKGEIMQKIKKNETVRRPAVVKLAEQLKRQYPRWTDNKCATEAKKRFMQMHKV